MPAGINFINDQSISFEHGAYLEQSKQYPTTMNPLYELVPISEKPEKDGWYVLFPKNSDNDKAFEFLYKNGQWLQCADDEEEYSDISDYRWYSRPIDPETLKARIREELGKAWDASSDWENNMKEGDDCSPDRETYINSVTDKLFKQ